jgi:hypothetical protein
MTKFFYADPHGNIRENDGVLPLGLLKRKHVDGTILRFAIDPEKGKFWIQDPSFRARMSSGDKDAWHFLNQCLRFSKSKFGKGFLDREYGEPPDDVARKLSDYPGTWAALSDVLRGFDVAPPEIPVVEFVPNGTEKDLVSFSKGLRVNRLAKDAMGRQGEDIEHGFLDDLLQCFSLSKLGEIMANDQAFREKWEDHLREHPRKWFAAIEDGKPRIFEGPKEDVPERSLRDVGPTVSFAYVPRQKRIALLNHSPLELASYESTKGLLETIRKFVSDRSKVPAKDLILSFDPALSCPFVSTLRRYRIPWHMLGEKADAPGDLRVLEVPIDVVNGAKVLGSNREERELVPSCLEYRVGHGLDMKYPFMAVDNRIKSRGRKFKRMLDEVLRFLGRPNSRDVPGLEGLLSELRRSRDPEFSDALSQKVSFLMRMGLEADDVLDFLVEPNDTNSRARHVRAVREAETELQKQARRAGFLSKTAAIGPSYDVNSWWHLGLQEELNRAQHDKPKAKTPDVPVQKKKKEPVTYEKLLDKDRDKNSSSMKSTEQLLRESQI